MLKCNTETRAQWLELLDLENQRYAVANIIFEGVHYGWKFWTYLQNLYYDVTTQYSNGVNL